MSVSMYYKMYVYMLGGKCLNLELSCDKKP